MDEPIKKEPIDRPVHDWAHYDGKDYPRCQAKPTKKEDQELRQIAPVGTGLTITGTFGCALPKGHEKFPNLRHQPHSWIRIGD